jgi:hypothetical protein
VAQGLGDVGPAAASRHTGCSGVTQGLVRLEVRSPRMTVSISGCVTVDRTVEGRTVEVPMTQAYAWGVLVAAMAALVLPIRSRPGMELSPAEMGYLSGGAMRAVATVLFALVAQWPVRLLNICGTDREMR